MPGERTQTRRLTLVSSGIIQVEEDWNQNIQYVATLEDEKEEFLEQEHKTS